VAIQAVDYPDRITFINLTYRHVAKST